MDFDAFDVGPRPLIEHEGDIDAPRIGVAGGARDGLRKGIAEFCEFDGENFVCLVQHIAVEHGAGPRKKQPPEFLAVKSRHIADDIDLAEVIERALVDRKRQRESVCRGIIVGIGRRHTGVGIAFTAII